MSSDSVEKLTSRIKAEVNSLLNAAALTDLIDVLRAFILMAGGEWLNGPKSDQNLLPLLHYNGTFF